MIDLTDIERMTIREYRLRMQASRLQRLDTEYLISLQAFKNQQIQATTGGKSPKPKYKNFKEFFDYEKHENEILGIQPVQEETFKDNTLRALMLKANS